VLRADRSHTDSEVSIPQSAAGLTANCVFDVAVCQLSVLEERGAQLGGTATTQHHVERRLVRAKLAFSRLYALKQTSNKTA